MNAVILEVAKRCLDAEILARTQKDGKEAAVAFVDELLEIHRKDCDEACPGGQLLREARAKLVNPLDESELVSLGIKIPRKKMD
jgi:hypothetical protein